MKAVVIRLFYDERDVDGSPPPAEVDAVFGPFPDDTTAWEWAKSAAAGSGWCRFEYKVEVLQPVLVAINTEGGDL